MCDCEHHHDRARPCTCICPEHRNFEAAFALAMTRYDEILGLRAALAEAEQKGAREALLAAADALDAKFSDKSGPALSGSGWLRDRAAQGAPDVIAITTLWGQR